MDPSNDFDLTDAEYAPVAQLPIESLVDLAAELEIVVGESIDRRSLIGRCVMALVVHGRREGLPFSKYDVEDLDALDRSDRDAIASLMGLRAGTSSAAIVKAGAKVYKRFESRRIDHPIPLMLPMLLSAVARAARTR